MAAWNPPKARAAGSTNAAGKRSKLRPPPMYGNKRHVSPSTWAKDAPVPVGSGATMRRSRRQSAARLRITAVGSANTRRLIRCSTNARAPTT